MPCITSQKQKLQPASPKNLEMHPQGPPFPLNVVATVAKAVGSVDLVATVEPVDAEIAIRVSEPLAKLSAILQMHAESEKALTREETKMSALASSVGFQATSQLIASSTNVEMSGGK
jgi:hypothetical protein